MIRNEPEYAAPTGLATQLAGGTIKMPLRWSLLPLHHMSKNTACFLARRPAIPLCEIAGIGDIIITGREIGS